MTPSQQSIFVNPVKMRAWGMDGLDFFFLAAVLFSFLWISRMPFAPSKYGDICFHEEAKQVARLIQGVGTWNNISIARAPGPVLYYSLPYLLVHPNSPDEAYWRAALAWNAFWMFISILLIRRTGDILVNSMAGKIAAILSLLPPFAIYYSFGIAAETPAYFAAVVFLYGWAKWRKTSPTQLFTTGSCISLAGLIALILCRPNALVVLGIAAACSIFLWRQRSPRRIADASFAILCVTIGLVSVFLVSLSLNHLPDKRGVNLQAANFSDVLFQGGFQYRSEPWDWRFWGKGTRSGSVDYRNWVNARTALLQESSQTGVPVAKLETNWTVRDILHHPWVRLRMFAVRVLATNTWIVNSTSPETFHLGPFPARSVFLLFHIFLNGLALLPVFVSAWFLSLHREKFFSDWPLWGPWLGLLVFHSFVYTEPRYMLPALPGLALLAACAITQAVENSRSSVRFQIKNMESEA